MTKFALWSMCAVCMNPLLCLTSGCRVGRFVWILFEAGNLSSEAA